MFAVPLVQKMSHFWAKFKLFYDESVSPRSWSCQRLGLQSWVSCVHAMGDFMGSTLGCLHRKPKPFLPKPLKQHQCIQQHWLLPSPLWEAVSLHWCNGGCLLKVLSWLMQLFPLCRIAVSFPLLYSLAVYSFLPSPCSFPRTCHYVSASVGGSGSSTVAGAPGPLPSRLGYA